LKTSFLQITTQIKRRNTCNSWTFTKHRNSAGTSNKLALFKARQYAKNKVWEQSSEGATTRILRNLHGEGYHNLLPVPYIISVFQWRMRRLETRPFLVGHIRYIYIYIWPGRSERKSLPRETSVFIVRCRRRLNVLFNYKKKILLMQNMFNGAFLWAQ